MPHKKVVPVRFYSEIDEDLIEWLEGLAAGEGNQSIKAMLRAGIVAVQNGKGHPTQSTFGASIAALDPASLQTALEGFLPRIREIVDASLASAHFTSAGNETASPNENTASPDMLKGHMIDDEDNE